MGLLSPGYWQSKYWARNYYSDDYWPEATPVSGISSNLLTPGHWQANYFPKGYYADDYWQDYGEVPPVPPVPPTPSGRAKIEIFPTRPLPGKIHKRYVSNFELEIVFFSKCSFQKGKIDDTGLGVFVDELLLIDEDLWLSEQ